MPFGRPGLLIAGLALLAACAPRPVALEIRMYDFTFDPERIEVPAGAEVRLTISNVGNNEHVWALVEAGYEFDLPFREGDNDHVLHRVAVDVGGREVYAFTAPTEPGEYPVICTIPEHPEAGMIGVLIVE